MIIAKIYQGSNQSILNLHTQHHCKNFTFIKKKLPDSKRRKSTYFLISAEILLGISVPNTQIRYFVKMRNYDFFKMPIFSYRQQKDDRHFYACCPASIMPIYRYPNRKLYSFSSLASVSEKIRIFSTLAGFYPESHMTFQRLRTSSSQILFNRVETHFLHFLIGSLLPQSSEVAGKFIIHSSYSSSVMIFSFSSFLRSCHSERNSFSR